MSECTSRMSARRSLSARLGARCTTRVRTAGLVDGLEAVSWSFVPHACQHGRPERLPRSQPSRMPMKCNISRQRKPTLAIQYESGGSSQTTFPHLISSFRMPPGEFTFLAATVSPFRTISAIGLRSKEPRRREVLLRLFVREVQPTWAGARCPGRPSIPLASCSAARWIVSGQRYEVLSGQLLSTAIPGTNPR